MTCSLIDDLASVFVYRPGKSGNMERRGTYNRTKIISCGLRWYTGIGFYSQSIVNGGRFAGSGFKVPGLKS